MDMMVIFIRRIQKQKVEGANETFAVVGQQGLTPEEQTPTTAVKEAVAECPVETPALAAPMPVLPPVP